MGFLRLWHDDQKETDEIDDNFINDRPVEEDVSFYRERDAFNANDYPRFLNQTRILSRQYMKILNCFMVTRISNQSSMLHKIDRTLLLARLRGLKNLSKNLMKP